MPLGLRMNSYNGKNSLLRLRCSCAGCVAKDWFKIRCLRLGLLLLWWLALFIVALVLFPNIGRKGSHNGQFGRGQLVQLILTKVVSAYKRLWW